MHFSALKETPYVSGNPGEEEDDLMALLSQPRENRRVFPGMGEMG
ncbi:MAG: hypothetical protein ABSC08_14565 [Bryobacteraceae bacterium]